MSKRATSPLFPGEEPIQYLVDTSSWLSISDQTNSTLAWRIIRALIAADRLFSPTRVVGADGEVKSIADQVQPFRDQLTKCDRNDAAYLFKAGLIAFKYPRLARVRGRKTPADPWLVALALLDGYTIVAEESLRNRPNGKILGVCRKESVPCICLANMVADEAGII
jgi:hypothetical protein